VVVKLRSKEIRKISLNAYATLGDIDSLKKYEYQNNDNPIKYITMKPENIKLLTSKKNRASIKKMNAGKIRILGFKSIVRGTAMNPVDHPHGGKSRGKLSMTPWAKLTKGQNTRKKRKSNSHIVRSRKKKII